MRLKMIAALLAATALTPLSVLACDTPVSVCDRDTGAAFALIRNATPVSIYVDATDDPAVLHVAGNFAKDLERVSGKPATVVHDLKNAKGQVVIIGSLGHNSVVDGLVASGAVRADDLSGQWEAYRQVVVDKPFAGIDRALVIVGSDRRGAVFGTYDISAKIGVSPWYWWADVPVERRRSVYITAGERQDQPKVKYRGLFINDEEPAFGNWAREKFGGINADMYENVFELNLRLKGNFLWPAMWGKAFNDDDPRNYKLADEMGIVVSTSHHEPMMRAQDEWHRNKDQGVTGGAWNYVTNGENLRKFWRGGIERMTKTDGTIYDSLVTLGMRGDGDEPMTEGTATELLETIVADQRKIIADVTGRAPEATPQVWALYKEVQDYYDHGMQVPDDVLLLFADDNWGQIRRLPTKDFDRKGGYGVYYHFDYVGGPRNYKWIDTIQIEKTWQQMDLAYVSGARDLWVVNVGDIKPAEIPLSFFLDMAWNPEAMTPEALAHWSAQWAAQQFGVTHSEAIADLMTRYATISSRRKPELVDADTFSVGTLEDLKAGRGEWQERVAELKALEADAEAIGAKLRPDQQDAFFHLVSHRIIALSNLYQLYEAVAMNRALHGWGYADANKWADRAEALFKNDEAISARYHAMNGGKWNHMMSQTRIGYTYWQQPETQVMPKVERNAYSKAAPAFKVTPEPFKPDIRAGDEFGEKNEVVSIEAPNFKRSIKRSDVGWAVIPHLGRTLGAVVSLPQDAPSTTPEDNVRLEYDIRLIKDADTELHVYLVPTLDTRGQGGLRFGVSIDDGPVQILSFDLIPDKPDWEKAVSDNAHVIKVPFKGLRAGDHTIKIWRIDANVVIQKLVLDTGGLKPSYLGPPQSHPVN
ncbi:glycosyl hydrolase 115 family protein [Asticcacaulis tiandongensis]|uniref:glycosyl hydrolase 115 family protein n=1 Tax=Asticcacaulis tiandongensis TaxID=2565365 RepID=UPI00112CAEFB|nr:glycosyl hydrolase 115 family protein [Asticcacaulis tiandongensis]